MIRKHFLTPALMLMLLLGITACTPAVNEEAPPPQAAEPALTITGKVANETGWMLDELWAMETIMVETTNKSGEAVQNTGVKLTSLLEEAGLQEGESTLTFVGSDGYEAQVDATEIQFCAECIVAIQDDGTLSVVLPGFPGNVQVKGVVEIRAE